MGLLWYLITIYRLIIFWKAQITANSNPPYFNMIKLFSNLKKNYETAFWIENCRQKFKMSAIINKYHVARHFKMMKFFNCCVQICVYFTEGYSEGYNLIQWDVSTASIFATQYMRTDQTSNFDQIGVLSPKDTP